MLEKGRSLLDLPSPSSAYCGTVVQGPLGTYSTQLNLNWKLQYLAVYSVCSKYFVRILQPMWSSILFIFFPGLSLAFPQG